MSFLRVPLFTLISYCLLLHLGFCKAYQNCLVTLIKITTVYSLIRIGYFYYFSNYNEFFNSVPKKDSGVFSNSESEIKVYFVVSDLFKNHPWIPANEAIEVRFVDFVVLRRQLSTASYA